MSKNTKNLLTILIVAIVFCIIAVAAAIGGAGLLVNRFKDNIASDPTKVQQMADEFVHYQVPSGYTNQMGMDLVIYKMILINSSDLSSGKPMIFLAHFQSTDLTADQMTQQMQQSVEQQSGSNGLKLKVVENRKVTINGQEAPLAVSEGADSAGTAYRQWVTAFPGKTGFIIILIQGKTSAWDDAVFNEFLASISF
ncbi:MAG: hypothetical protein WA821_10230 [Anaerolineales bacterium]